MIEAAEAVPGRRRHGKRIVPADPEHAAETLGNGLFRRLRKRDKRYVYWNNFTFRGHDIYEPLGLCSLDEARAKNHEAWVEARAVVNGEKRPEPARRIYPVREVGDTYVADMQARGCEPSSIQSVKGHLKIINLYFGDRSFDEINPQDVRDFRDELLKTERIRRRRPEATA